MDALSTFHWVLAGLNGVLLLGTLASLLSQPVLRMRKGKVSRAVSVLIPARNEESKIASCLRSLRAQEGLEEMEIFLLDDNSEDSTRAIAEGIAGEPEGHPLTVLSGEPLPGGWGGKPWACHQLSQSASHDSLLFVDADTDFEPGAVAAAMRLAEKEGAGLCSVWPHQVMRTWAEQLVIPLVYFLGVSFLPLWLQRAVARIPLLSRLPSALLRELGVANGQFMLFTRDAYEALGGHERVKDHMVEDVALGRSAMEHRKDGLILVNARSGGLVRCRMYENTAQVVEGFSKNIRPLFEGGLLKFCFAGLIVMASLLYPVLFLFWAITAPAHPGSLPIFLAAGAIFLIRVLLALVMRGGFLSILAHPLGTLMGLGIGLLSCWKTMRGTLVWKGRQYAQQGGERRDV